MHTLRQGFTCKWFVPEGILGNKGRGVGKRDKEGKTTDKDFLGAIHHCGRLDLKPAGDSLNV